VGLQLYGMTADLLRGGAVAFVALLVARPLLAAVGGAWALDARTSLAVVVSACAMVAVAALWKRAGAASGAQWYLVAGLVLGGLTLWLR
jgi:PTS system mannose-specific IIC component